MRSRRRKSEPVDPNPHMLRGETDFEERRILCEFALLFPRIASLGLSSISDTHEYAFRQGYFMGKAAGIRERLSPITETLTTSPQDASVRETAGANKEQQDGITTSD